MPAIPAGLKDLILWPKLHILLKEFISATPLKPLNRISRDVEVKI